MDVEVLLEDEYLYLPKIEWWLLKYESAYQDVISSIEAIPSDYTFPRIGDRYASEFMLKDLYELLEGVSVCYRNEAYFNNQLELYDEVSNNVTELNSWLDIHKLIVPKEQSIFMGLFADIRGVKGYNYELRLPLGLDFTMKVNPIDFQSTLRFLDIIERSKKVIIIGTVKYFESIEVIEEKITKTKEYTSTSPTYKRQDIVVSANNSQNNEHLIRFLYGKIELLKDVYVGQMVKVYLELCGGVLENEKGTREYWNLLKGWDIEVLEDYIHEAEF